MSFLADIFPLFNRLADLQWVNQGVLNRYGWDSPEQFMSPEYLARLADPSPANAAFRQALFARFRNPDYATLEGGDDLLPPLYGDAITLPPVSPRSYLAVQPFQYAALQSWAAGDFVPGVAGADPVAARGSADRGAAGGARSRRARGLPRRRVPSRLRGDLADARRLHVRVAVPAPAPQDGPSPTTATS